MEEIDAVVPGNVPSMSDKLPLMDAFIKESMRMSPAVGLLYTRYAAQDTTVPNPGFPQSVVQVKKGTAIIADIFGLNFNEKIYAEPNTFCPERFLSQDGKQGAPVFGFGGGNRICKCCVFLDNTGRPGNELFVA